MTKCITCQSENVDCCRLGRADQFNCHDCGTGWAVVIHETYDDKAVIDTVTISEAVNDGDNNIPG